MAEHMHQYAESGLTQKAYCETHGINKSTFAYWLKKHRSQLREESGGFVQIRSQGLEVQTEIRFANGTVVRFSGRVDVRYLKELVG
jgi:transposase-like protein